MYFSCIKTYVNSLRYTFTVIGVVALGVIIGIGCFGKMSGQAVTTMTQTIKEDYEAADLSPSYIQEAVVNRAGNLTAWDILNVIHEKSIKPLLIGEIEDSIEKVVDNYSAFADKIYDSIVICADRIVTALAIGLLLITFSQMAGFFGVEICVRRRLSRVRFSRLLLEMFVRFIMLLLAAFIVFGLCSAFQQAARYLLCLLPVLQVLFGLIAAWLTSDSKKTGFTDIVSFASYGWLLLANLTMLAATAFIGFFVYRLTNIVAAVLICNSLLTVMLVAMDLSASAIVLAAGKKAILPAMQTAAEETPAMQTAAEETPAMQTAAAETPGIPAAEAKITVPADTPAPASGDATVPANTPAPAPGDTTAYGDADEITDGTPEMLQRQLKSRLKTKLQEQNTDFS